MKKVLQLFLCPLLTVLLFACTETHITDDWQLGPFVKYDGNPIITPQGDSWESKDVFNPAAWADGERIYMFYRAEDSTGIGEWNGTSRIGLAISYDGFNFEREPEPVFEPTEEWELPGGAEDPRIARIDDTFYMTYTAYDGETARLGLASSQDMRNWEKHGLVFPDLGWSKAGAIVPMKIDDRYWMYFGDTNIWAAWSENLIDWTMIQEPVMEPREGMFDSGLIEPGPTPLITEHGILMLYNSADDDLVYRTGQALFDISDPTNLLERSDTFFMEPDFELEVDGQIPNVVFIEGYAELNGRGFLYYGMGDSGIGVASVELNQSGNAVSNIAEPEDRIQPYTENPRYWQYKGEPILLLGASDQDNLFNHPDIWPFGLESHLDLMVKNGGNYVRNTMSSRDHGNPWPFEKNEDGSYDLETWGEEYWQRFEEFLEMTYERDIIVQIEVWDRFDFAQGPWNENPFNPANNINYSEDDSRLPEAIDTHPGQRENPFFRSTPDFEDNPLILEFQRELVDKMLSISLEYPHVLYCVSNETNESPLWSDYWAEFIKNRAADKGQAVHITEMWDAWDLSDPEHDATFDKPDLYTYVDISQNNHQDGQTHWDNAQKVRNERLTDGQRPMNSVKIYGGMRHGKSFEEGTNRLWRNIFGGFASSRFHRTSSPFTPSGIGLSPLAQTQIRSLRMFTDQMNVFMGEPANHLLSEREDNEAYAFAEPGSQYAIYFTDGGTVILDLSSAERDLSVKWLDIMNSEWHEETTTRGGGQARLTAPQNGPWAVLLTAVGPAEDD